MPGNLQFTVFPTYNDFPENFCALTVTKAGIDIYQYMYLYKGNIYFHVQLHCIVRCNFVSELSCHMLFSAITIHGLLTLQFRLLEPHRE